MNTNGANDNSPRTRIPAAGERMFLDKHTPEGLFDPRTECGRALVTGRGNHKFAIFFDGPGPKFRHQELTHDKIAFGRWWPLASIVSKGTDIGDDLPGVLEVENGLIRMLMLWSDGNDSWEVIGITDADDGFIDDYDIMVEGWTEPFASRDSDDDHDAAAFELAEPLYSSFVMDITT